MGVLAVCLQGQRLEIQKLSPSVADSAPGNHLFKKGKPMNTRKKISLAVLGAMSFLQFSGIVMAADKKEPTINLAVSALTKYVWRGFANSNDSLVLQPSATVAFQGFSANVWGNLDTDPYASSSQHWTETDFTLAYDYNLGPVGLTAGYIYYNPDGTADTQEVFGRVAVHSLLTPTLTVYRDFDHLPGWYATLGVSQGVPITKDLALNLGAQIGYLNTDDASSYAEIDNPSNAYRGFHDGLLSASLPIPFSQTISLTPVLNYSFPLANDAKDLIKAGTPFSDGHSDFLYGGVTVAMAF